VVFRENLGEESSPMTSIQDLQREQESFFFDQTMVNDVKPIKGVKGSPGTSDQISKFLCNNSCDVNQIVL